MAESRQDRWNDPIEDMRDRIRARERLFRNIQISPTGCWLWERTRGLAGYGWMYWRDKMRPAHRVAYMLFIGKIPEGYEIDHRCRERGCVNPDHLEAVTRSENVRRGMGPAITAYRSATRQYCHRGHLLDEANTYRTSRNGRWCRECRREAGRRHNKKRRGTK
jgi:HNH endonuclease